MKFSDYPLKAGLLRSLDAIGYTEPTKIQQEVLSIGLDGANIVGQSQTGTGKTLAFLLPVLNQVDTNLKQTQVLILAPTRELVTQIGDEIAQLTAFYGVSYACVFGGASQVVQKKRLVKKPAVIIATPGRLMDFIKQKVVDIRPIHYLILDEVDRMLDMGFVRDMERIRGMARQIKQHFTFSATMNDDMMHIIKKHVHTYETIKIGNTVTVDKIDHSFIPVDHIHKLSTVAQLIKDHKGEKIIIFTHTKRNTKTLQEVLAKSGHKISMFNGDMSQGKRQKTLDSFKNNQIQILVTTDVAARGLNMDNVGLVINFEAPIDPKSYIHRIGRTGRAGKEGKAIMLVSEGEKALVKAIEKEHNTSLNKSMFMAIEDVKGTFRSIKLNKSTDKQGGGRSGGGSRRGNNNGGFGDKGRSRKSHGGSGGKSGSSRGRKPRGR